MQQYLRSLTLILSLVIFGCQPEPSPDVQNTQGIDKGNFDTEYIKSKDLSRSREERLESANLAYQEAKTAFIDSLKIKALQEKTKLHSLLKQKDSAIIFSKELLNLSLKTNDSGAIGNAYYKLGLYNTKIQQLDSAFYYYNESKKVYESQYDSLATAKNLNNMAILSSNAGIYSESDELAIEGLSFLKNFEKTNEKASFYNCLAVNTKNQKDYKEALYWYDLAIRTTKDNKNRVIYESNVANIYRIQGDYPQAITLYKNLLADLEKNEDKIHLIRTENNLNYALWLQSKDPALEDKFLEGLELRKNANSISGQITSHKYLTEFYLYSNSNKARFHAKSMYELASSTNHIDDRLESLQLLMRAFEDDPKSYNKYAKTFIALQDSIQLVKNKLGNKYEKIRFDSEQKRDENEALKTANLEKELALSQSQQMNTIYVALGVLSLISFFFIFILFRSKYQKEKLEEIYLTETRISKKVHDEVANDVYKTMVDLERNNLKKESLLDDLEQIYEKTRDISREFNALDLDQQFSEVLKDLLFGYKNEDVNIITKGMSQVNLDNIAITKKTVIYRVLQELMTNMKKHSQASLAILTFKEVKNKLLITYSDDGVGCDLKKSNGLLNAENRINSLNGKLTLSSSKNQGFKATILI